MQLQYQYSTVRVRQWQCHQRILFCARLQYSSQSRNEQLGNILESLVTSQWLATYPIDLSDSDYLIMRSESEFESDWYWLDQIVVAVFILISSLVSIFMQHCTVWTWTIAMWGPDHLYISLWIASSTLIGPRESYAFCPSWWQKWLSHHHQHLQSAEDFSQLQLDNDIKDKISQPQTVLLQSC